MAERDAHAPRTRLLGSAAGGCTSACSEMHTFSWPCSLSVMPAPLRWTELVRIVWAQNKGWAMPTFTVGWFVIGITLGGWTLLTFCAALSGHALGYLNRTVTHG